MKLVKMFRMKVLPKIYDLKYTKINTRHHAFVVIPLITFILLNTSAYAAKLHIKEGESMSRLNSLNTIQGVALSRAGIKTLGQLASAPSTKVSKLLRIKSEMAKKIIREAKLEKARLHQVYTRAKKQFRLAVRTIPLPDAYGALIGPENECTLLVRKVCGLENQGANTFPCQKTKELLALFNTYPDHHNLAADTCVAALGDEIVFPQWQ